jgi:hypothetical protein
MKPCYRYLVIQSGAVAAILVCAACSGGSFAPSSTSSPGLGASTSSTLMTTVPAGGGTVAIPAVSDIDSSFTFGSGAPSGDTLKMSGSTTAPINAPQPQSVTRRSSGNAALPAQAGTASPKGYYYATFSVTQPIDASLITSMTTSGEVPLAAQQLGAELDDITSFGGQMLETMGCTAGASSVTCAGVPGAAQLVPGHTYLMQFTATTATIQLALVNDTGIEPVYFYISGNNAVDRTDPKFYRVTASGELVPMEMSDLSNGFADYNIPFPATGTTFPLPLVRAGRIYISVGAKMKVQLNPGSGAIPAFWVAPAPWSNSGDPNYDVLFDWVEFDYSIGPDTHLPTMGVNKTEVQMFGLPFQMFLTSASGSVEETTGSKPNTRASLFSAIAANTTFGSLIQGANSQVPLRIISPDNGLYNSEHSIPNVPTFDQHYLDAYIADAWKMYASEPLTMYTSAWGSYTGMVNAQNVMVFTPPAGNADQTTISIAMPASSDAIIGNGTLTAPCVDSLSTTAHAVCYEIASAMSAAFNRSTLLVYPFLTRNYTNGSCKTDLYYANSPTNVYSHLIHEDSLPTQNAPGGAAYGFGFDDNCNQSSYISDTSNPSRLTVTVEPF